MPRTSQRTTFLRNTLRTGLLAAAFALLGASLQAAPLSIQVFTGSPRGFFANSTLISGEKDAILVEAQYISSDAHRVIAMILESGKHLTTVYVTHDHPDHYFGLTAIRQAFPDAKLIALPATVEAIHKTWRDQVAARKRVYGANIPSEPVLPEPMEGTSLTLEGETLQVVGGQQGDSGNNSYVWIPSLKTAIVGDIAFSGFYQFTARTSRAERAEWIKTLDRIVALNPSAVITGHKVPTLKDDPGVLGFVKAYLQDYDAFLAESKTSEELQAKVKAKYPAVPGAGLIFNDQVLKISADAAYKTS